MKKIIITLAIAFSSVIAFAGEVNVSSNILNSFGRDFAGATGVQWTTGNKLAKASFVFNGQHVIAFYNLDGELMGITRNITSLDLPLYLQTSLKKDYQDYWISDLFELSNDNGTSYYITLQNADGSVVLKSSEVKWTVYKKYSKA